MPRSIRIGPYTFTLRVDDAAVMGTQDSIVAFTDLPKRVMTFSSNADQPASVVHESLHAIFDQSCLNIRLGSEREEDVIQSIDHGVLAWIRANPALMRYLVEG